MTSLATSERISALLSHAEEARAAGKTQDAFIQLREAAHLDSSNAEVIRALQRLELRGSSDVLQDAQRYAASGSKSDLEKLLHASVGEQALCESDAKILLELVLSKTYKHGDWSKVFRTLLHGSLTFRKATIACFETRQDALIQLLLDTEAQTSKALFDAVLDSKAWRSNRDREAMLAAIFKGLLDGILSTNISEDSRLAEYIAKLCSTLPQLTKEFAVKHIFAAVFCLLDCRRSQLLQIYGTSILSSLFKAAPEASEKVFTDLVTSYVTSQDPEKLIQALSAAAKTFALDTAVCARLFLIDGFLQSLTPTLIVSKVIDETGIHSTAVAKAVLDLLSAACIDRSCRDATLKICDEHLRALSGSGVPDLSTKAALILVKLSGGDTAPEVISRLMVAATSGSNDAGDALEALVYASLKPSIKEKIISQDTLLKKILDNIKTRTSDFACLTILVNLTAYRPARSEEQKKMAQLKAYANSTKPVPDDPLDNDSVVTIRCRKLLDAGLVSVLVAAHKTQQDEKRQRHNAETLNSLAREAKHRAKMAQEGAVKLLMQMSQGAATVSSDTEHPLQQITGHALSRILISTNPAHIFSKFLPASSAAIVIISTMLASDQTQEERNLLPVFEALLALTNLASLGDPVVCEVIIAKGWTILEDQLLLSSNILVRRASVELICNLMLCPAGVAKFADGSDSAARRMHILLALADVDDTATRCAAGGTLAMLTEWDTAVSAILKVKRGAKILLSMCGDQSEAVKHRGVICVLQCVSMPGIGAQAIQQFTAEGGREVIREMKDATTSEDISSAAADILVLLR